MNKTTGSILVGMTMLAGASGYMAGEQTSSLPDLTDQQRYIEVEVLRGREVKFDLSKMTPQEVEQVGTDAAIVAKYLGADIDGAIDKCTTYRSPDDCNLYKVIQQQADNLASSTNPQ